MKMFFKYISGVCILVSLSYTSCELISLSLAGSAFVAASGWYSWKAIKDVTYCKFTECCNDSDIPFDIEKLQESFSQRMFGQPLVNELLNVISAHKQIINEKNRNKKALVISLHGWSGVGKNFAASMIAESIYRKGMDSKYVKLFMGKKDFSCDDLEKKKEMLTETLRALVKKCPRSLIIFDEIHHMCPSVLDTIKPMLDHHSAVDDVDYRDAIFIFISNIGGQEIATKLLELYEQGVTRPEVEFHDFEPIIRRTAYFQGGFEKAAAIAHHLIDHYVPFLPLEQHHVELCALAEFKAHGIEKPSEKMMVDALSVITYGPTETQAIFANNGCRRFTRHIPYVIKKHSKNTEL